MTSGIRESRLRHPGSDPDASGTQWRPRRTGHGEPILVVDDDPQIRRMCTRILAAGNFSVTTAECSGAALAAAGEAAFSLAICDVHLGAESGTELARRLKQEHPSIATLIISGYDDPPEIVDALESGWPFAYLVKPFTANELRINVENALLQRELELEATACQERLEHQVDQRTQELREAIQGLVSSREATIRHLSKAVEMRDATTHAHIDRIGEISAVLARALGWPEAEIDLLRMASPMHDVGKIGIPDRILLKPGALSEEERAEMQRHTTIGYEILSGSDSTLLNLAATIALTHHERFDGLGYPRGLERDAIPEAGRIVAVADVFDALVNDRVYRPAIPLDEARKIMRAGRGTQFDPTILDALFDHLDEVLALEGADLGSRLLPSLS